MKRSGSQGDFVIRILLAIGITHLIVPRSKGPFIRRFAVADQIRHAPEHTTQALHMQYARCFLFVVLAYYHSICGLDQAIYTPLSYLDSEDKYSCFRYSFDVRRYISVRPLLVTLLQRSTILFFTTIQAPSENRAEAFIAGATVCFVSTSSYSTERQPDSHHRYAPVNLHQPRSRSAARRCTRIYTLLSFLLRRLRVPHRYFSSPQ